MTSKTPALLLRSAKGRFYGTAATAKQSVESSGVQKHPARITKLDNGLRVASIENGSPVSQVGIIVNAGSRIESRKELGITHFLRVATNMSTQNMSDLGVVRAVEQSGANLGVTGNREYMLYSIDALRSEVYNGGAQSLLEIVTAPAFKKWELDFGPIRRQVLRNMLDCTSQPQIQLMEMVHEAAFKDTLGRSLFAPAHFIPKFNQESLLSFHNQHFSPDRMALVGLGIDHENLVAMGKKMGKKNPSSSAPSVEKASYLGGEMRRLSDEPMTHCVVVTEGPSLKSKDLFATCILQQIMGTGPFVKYSGNTISKLGKGVSEALKGSPFAASCMSMNYTDSGLFGFYLCTQPEDMEKAIKTAMGIFGGVTKTGITDEELARGKAQLKASIAMSMENSENVFLDLAEQILFSDKVVTQEEVMNSIDSVQASDVTNVAKRVINGKPTMVSLGDLSTVPYLDQLKS